MNHPLDIRTLISRIRDWGRDLAFDAVGVSDIDLKHAEPGLAAWLERGFHGDMQYMERHGMARARPAQLMPRTVSIISARMNYRAPSVASDDAVLADADLAYVSRYALGRDYHKVLRHRLETLAQRIQSEIGAFGYRVFTDSAPVLEIEIAAKAGLGWRGKHTLLLHREAGSWFFLGEIFTDLPLPADSPVPGHCGTCERCIDVCPTQAIVAPYRLDARRCISYLTIEHPGSIPEPLRPLIGNRVYGCDDCQLVCPWNKYARISSLPDFDVRHGLDRATLLELFAWTQAQFNERMRGSAIRRIGYERWLRNLAVGLGNARASETVIVALEARGDHPSPLVREHVRWALAQQRERLKLAPPSGVQAPAT